MWPFGGFVEPAVEELRQAMVCARPEWLAHGILHTWAMLLLNPALHSSFLRHSTFALQYRGSTLVNVAVFSSDLRSTIQ